MRFSIAHEHLSFFRRHQAIEFTEFLTLKQLKSLKEAVASVLKERLKVPSVGPLRRPSAEERFLVGRDLWRANAELRHLLTQGRLAEVVGELSGKRTIRLAYDQLFPIESTSKWKESEKYSQFLKAVTTLNEASCISPLLCAVMIYLGDSASASPISQIREFNKPLDVFPDVSGNVILFHPDSALDFSQLLNGKIGDYLLVAYAPPISNYRLNFQDLHVHALRQLGYTEGEPLNDRCHPMIYS